MKGKKGLINRILAALCFTMALVLLLSGLGATLAKYIRQDSKPGTAAAMLFYFESEELDGEYHTAAVNTGTGEAQITVSLSNYLSENEEDTRCTQRDTQYNCWAYWADDSYRTPIEGTEQSGTLSGGTKTKDDLTIRLKESDFGESRDRVVTVVAQSTSPYAKTLMAEFGLSEKANELQWNVEEQENAVVLEIAGGSGGPVTVTWPDSLLADPYNELLQGVSGNSVTFAPQPGTRYALTFLKESAGTYNEEDFTVTEN